jgi:MFS family permease
MIEDELISIKNKELIPIKLKIYSLITLLNSYSHGIIIPVLSLILLSKGLSLSKLSLVLGLYALTVVVLELPTGIAADVLGRKNIFCLSLIVSILSFGTILFGQGILLLCIGMMFYGLSRALSSGSFDALFIDWYIGIFGKDKIHKITTRLSVLDALGLSLGAITGGFLPIISKKLLPQIGIYNLNLIIKILLTLVTILISYIFISETAISKKTERTSFIKHIHNSSTFILENKTLPYIFISILSTGFFLSALETYWQPQFKSLITNDSLLWLLGILAFLYLGAAMFGGILSEKLIDKFKPNNKKMYLWLRLALAISIILMAIQTKIPSFITLYTITYLFFGMANIPESVIINGEIPNEIRASILSTTSLVFQFGALFGSLINSIVINYISISTLWFIAASIILATLLVIFKKL